MATKKSRPGKADELRKEYDVSKLANPVRGKYHRRATEGSNLAQAKVRVEKKQKKRPA